VTAERVDVPEVACRSPWVNLLKTRLLNTRKHENIEFRTVFLSCVNPFFRAGYEGHPANIDLIDDFQSVTTRQVGGLPPARHKPPSL